FCSCRIKYIPQVDARLHKQACLVMKPDVLLQESAVSSVASSDHNAKRYPLVCRSLPSLPFPCFPFGRLNTSLINSLNNETIAVEHRPTSLSFFAPLDANMN